MLENWLNQMNQPQDLFETILEDLSQLESHVQEGNMMRSPGMKYKDKVFAFFYKEAMGFRLGPNFDPKSSGIENAKPLSPFKTKPPLKGWFIIDASERDRWAELSSKALEFTKTIN